MWLTRLAYALALGLTLGGLTHIASLLGVPFVAPHGPYERLAGAGADGRFVVLSESERLPFQDPAFVVAACRYDLSDGGVTIRASLPSSYGAISVHDRRGQPFYALTDRAATEGSVEVTVLDRRDAAAAAVEEPAEGRPALRIVSPTKTGFVLLRLFAPAPSARPALRARAEQASCGRAAGLVVSP